MHLQVLVPAEPASKQATGSTEVLPTVLLMRLHHPHHLEQSLTTRNDGVTEQRCRSAFASGMSISISMWDNPGCEDLNHNNGRAVEDSPANSCAS